MPKARDVAKAIRTPRPLACIFILKQHANTSQPSNPTGFELETAEKLHEACYPLALQLELTVAATATDRGSGSGFSCEVLHIWGNLTKGSL